jgi:hypothetical protein
MGPGSVKGPHQKLTLDRVRRCRRRAKDKIIGYVNA